MLSSMKGILRLIRYLLMLSIMLSTWAVLGMVYLDDFVYPFKELRPVLMPWRVPEPENATTGERLDLMRRQLASSRKTANYAFFGMSGAFAVFCVYLTFVYQQK